MIKNQNEELSGKKVELTQELKKAKDDLSNLIEKGESQKNQYLKEINNLKEMERKLAETRDKEKKQFEDMERNNSKKIAALNESLQRKENEVDGLKKQLMDLNEREAQRMEDLEKEAEFFKNILKKYWYYCISILNFYFYSLIHNFY